MAQKIAAQLDPFLQQYTGEICTIIIMALLLVLWHLATPSFDAHSITSDPKIMASQYCPILQYNSPCIDKGSNLGATYDDALHPLTNFGDPDTIYTADQDKFGEGWEIGAYVFEPIGLR